MIVSDGEVPIFGRAVPHPRSYGTFVRVLGVYVREKHLEIAIKHGLGRLVLPEPPERFIAAEREATASRRCPSTRNRRCIWRVFRPCIAVPSIASSSARQSFTA